MTELKKTLLELHLSGMYYKGDDITDRYMFSNDRLVITQSAIDALDDPNEQLYIVPLKEYNKESKSKDSKIEKLNIEIQDERTGNAYIKNEHGTKCYLTKHSKIIANKVNEIIDRLIV